MKSSTADNHPSFIRTQFAFADYIRDPDGKPLPVGVDPRRMAMYRELFINNVENFLSNNFPVLRKIMPEDHWNTLVLDFFATHRSKSPYFTGIPQEFLSFLQGDRTPDPQDPPYMLELAHYEWVEMALSIAEGETPQPDERILTQLLNCEIIFSQLARPLVYQYPVHKISPDYQPHTPPHSPTFLVVYRNKSDEIRFLEINQVTFRLIELLKEERLGRAAVLRIAEELGKRHDEKAMKHGEDILKKLARRGLIDCINSPIS